MNDEFRALVGLSGELLDISKGFDDSEPRDDKGRWTSGGGGLNSWWSGDKGEKAMSRFDSEFKADTKDWVGAKSGRGGTAQQQNAMKMFPALLPKEAAAIVAYTKGAFSAINESLRGGPGVVGKAAYADALDAASLISRGLNRLQSYEGNVTRGLSVSDSELSQWKVGNVWNSKAFLSATADTGGRGEYGNVVFKIDSATGKDVSPVSHYGGEREVVFDRNSSFLVTGSSEKKDKYGISYREIRMKDVT